MNEVRREGLDAKVGMNRKLKLPPRWREAGAEGLLCTGRSVKGRGPASGVPLPRARLHVPQGD